APGGFRMNGERTQLGEIGRQHGEGTAPEKPRFVAGDQKVAQVLEQEIARALQHPVLRGVPVDELLHRADVFDPRGPDGKAQPRTASAASASAVRTRSGAVPPGDAREARERSGRSASRASGSKRESKARSSAIVKPSRSFPLAS